MFKNCETPLRKPYKETWRRNENWKYKDNPSHSHSSRCCSLVWLVLVKCSFCTSTLSLSSFSQETRSIFNHRWVCLAFRTGIVPRSTVTKYNQFFFWYNQASSQHKYNVNKQYLYTWMYRIQLFLGSSIRQLFYLQCNTLIQNWKCL